MEKLCQVCRDLLSIVVRLLDVGSIVSITTAFNGTPFKRRHMECIDGSTSNENDVFDESCTLC